MIDQSLRHKTEVMKIPQCLTTGEDAFGRPIGAHILR